MEEEEKKTKDVELTGTEGLKAITPMDEKEFGKYLRDFHKLCDGFYIYNYECVGKFKSVRRAFKRGHLFHDGTILPDRPYNNRKPTKGRKINNSKRGIYERLRRG